MSIVDIVEGIVAGGLSGGDALRRDRAVAADAGVWNRRSTLIGVDCDGVLASDRLLWQRLRARFPEHIPARYDDLLTFEWPRATAETQALCEELSADASFMLRLTPIAGAVLAIRRLSRQGYRLVMITARPECVRDATRAWLLAQGISDEIEDIRCVPGGPAKPAVALELGCAAFIEDNYATAEAMGAAGLRSYLLDAPYNRMFTRRSVRVAGWSALIADLTARIPVSRRTHAVARGTAEPLAMVEGALAS